MCLYPKLIKNPKYKPNKKNNYNPPVCTDERLLYVPISCGCCIECRRKLANEWKTRLYFENLYNNTPCYFVTLTFTNESLLKLCEELKTSENNYIATKAVRRFLERYRKKYKKSLRHFLITELGHTGTERIHLHGIIWTDNIDIIDKIWGYGNIFVGWCNNRTINYVVKYITKIDNDHKNYKSITLCSPGIGKKYIYTEQYKYNEFDEENTKTTLKLPTGKEINLPLYYRNKRYNEEQREKLWLNQIERHERFVLGKRIWIGNEQGIQQYEQELKEAQRKNKLAGYGDDSKAWKKEKYNIDLRKINKIEKLKKLKNKQ